VFAEVHGGGGPLVLLLRTYRAVAPFGQWQYDAVDLTPYAGSNVTISFDLHKDVSTPSEFVVDDITLRACPGAAPTATGTTTPTKTMTPQPGASPTATRQPDCRNLFINGNFESGSLDPWQTSAGVSLDLGHSGAHGVRLGGWPGWAGRIWQSVTIPAGVSPIRMWFWWRADSTVERPTETLTVFVERGAMIDVLVTLGAVAPLNRWRIQSLDLTPYAGQTVSVVFEVMNGTIFRLDDIVLDACGLGTPTPPPGTGCEEPLQNGNFEAAALAPWTTTGAASLGPGHNSPKGIAFCGSDNAVGEVWQIVTIPAQGGAAWLKFWWMAEGSAPQPGDALDVLLASPMALLFQTPDVLLTLPATGALGQWREESVDITGYAGRQIVLVFRAHTDGTQPSLFRLDDVSLEACASGGRGYPLYIPLAFRDYRGSGPTPTGTLKPPTASD
jgi:hypothetical protein